MFRKTLAILGVTLFAFGPSTSFASDICAQLIAAKSADLEDGDVFARAGKNWMQFESLSLLNLRRLSVVEFAYVVKPASGDRSGILVVKTNRPARPGEAGGTVRLDRDRFERDRACKDAPAYWPPRSGDKVSTTAYEDYHDYSAARDTSELRKYEKTLRAFHVPYGSQRKGRCVRTDDTSSDNFPWNQNSNRAQFSFDKTVVQNGSYTVFRLSWPSSPFEGAADNLTQMKHYETHDGLACVSFRVPMTSPDYSVRVNDLEGVMQPSSRRRIGDRP